MLDMRWPVGLLQHVPPESQSLAAQIYLWLVTERINCRNTLHVARWSEKSVCSLWADLIHGMPFNWAAIHSWSAMAMQWSRWQQMERSNQAMVQWNSLLAWLSTNTVQSLLLIECNNRLVVLDQSLSRGVPLSLPVDVILNGPWALHLDESRDRLYVGEYEGGRLLVLENVKNIGVTVGLWAEFIMTNLKGSE